MKILLRRLAATAAMTLLLAAGAAQAQLPPASGIVINQTPVQGGSAGQCLFINNSQISSQACGGAGTVTSVSVTTANGVSGSVATATTTPAISLTLGAITPSSVAIGAGSAITSSGPGGALASGAYAAATPCSAFGTTAGTCAQGGVITAGGPTGSATVAPIITYNAAGQLTTVTSATITPAVGSLTGLGTGVGTALAINVGTAGAFITNGGALGTPSSGNGTNITNVNAATLGGATFAAPGPIGGGTPSTIAATSNTSPLIIGGTGATSTLSLESTSGVGTTDAIIGLTGSQVERFRVTTGGLFNIGPAVAPDALLTMNGNTGAGAAIVSGTFAHVIAADGAFGGIYIDVYGNQSFIIPRRANGTQASKTALIANDVAFAFGPNGWDGSIYTNVGAVNFIAAENYDGTHHGNAITFRTVPLASTAVAEAGRWNPSGGLSIGTTTDPGIGGLQVNGQQFNPNMASDSGIADSTVCTATTGGKYLKGSGTLGICLGTSGRQFKTAFAPMTAGMDEIAQLKLWNYRYIPGHGDGGKRIQFGPTAQDVEEVMPELVGYDDNGNVINYDIGAFLPMSLHALQQLNDRLTELERRR